VRCKSSLYWVVVVYYWDFELSYKHLVTSEAHHPFVPMYCSLVLLKTLFLSLVPYTTVCCISQTKKFAAPMRRASILGFRAEDSVWVQTEPKTKICFGLAKPSPRPSNHCKCGENCKKIRCRIPSPPLLDLTFSKYFTSKKRPTSICTRQVHDIDVVEDFLGTATCSGHGPRPEEGLCGALRQERSSDGQSGAGVK
jgi:hypothetical protein